MFTNGTSQGQKPSRHLHATAATWSRLQDLIQNRSKVILDGMSLSIADVVAVAQYNVIAVVSKDDAVTTEMEKSLEVLRRHLDEGRPVYGVNTGYGGSADTRTDNITDLQKALIQHHNAGVLLPPDRGLDSNSIIEDLKKHALPNQVVRASMLTRCNSLLRGHSAVRLEVVEAMITLLTKDLTPVIPLRGSVSASGDLTPLAYIAGMLEGNPDIYVNGGKQRQYRIMTAQEALGLAGLTPLAFGPKEGLGLMNGTSVSSAAAGIVIFQAQQLALLSQILTTMGTEALLGTSHNYHPFIASVRPHHGQREAAWNIFCWLSDSKLTFDSDAKRIGLVQDRYALRTASQWIGPQLEDLLLAQQQVEIELNSTTDNPIIDVRGDIIHHGGNFQAAVVTSAMEKTLLTLQMLGKVLFAQCSEIINPMLNKGLPPNLSADDPSLSFTFKGVDINMAAYMSELGYLAHPVSTHIQSAEMHNQAINSLALIACRYASDAVEVLSLMTATYLYVLCQALDLRVLHVEFVKATKPEVTQITRQMFACTLPSNKHDALCEDIWNRLMQQWEEGSRLDLRDRATVATANTAETALDFVTSHGPFQLMMEAQSFLLLRQQWKDQVVATLCASYTTIRDCFFDNPPTAAHLCSKSQRMYCYVRQTLNVPMHRGLEDHPTYVSRQEKGRAIKKTIGSNISVVYEALRSGGLMEAVMND